VSVPSIVRRGVTAGLVGAKTLSEPLLVGQPAAMTLSTLAGWRYPVYLLHALARAGVVGVHWRDLSIANAFLPADLFWRRIRNASALPQRRRGVVIADDTGGRVIDGERIVTLERRYYSAPRQPSTFVLPYFAHPLFYQSSVEPLARRLAAGDGARPQTLFFSGTVDEAHYAAAARFSLVVRPVILAALRQALLSPRLAMLARRSEIHLQTDIKDSDLKHQFTLPQYLEKLAGADFTLCPPGCGMPHSHNIIEAMAVGTIPITNYATWMEPALTHGVDCFAFNTAEELQRILDMLADLPQAQISRMRAAVRDYYARHLDPTAVGTRLLERLPTLERIAVNDETGR
jgi:glycosyltransferase involved in cell wall biosynthesis